MRFRKRNISAHVSIARNYNARFIVMNMVVSYYFPSTAQHLTMCSMMYGLFCKLFIKPDSYKVGKETLGGRVSDPLFLKSELEWSTDRQGSTIIYGLLVRLEATDTKGQLSIYLVGCSTIYLN